MLPRLVEGRLVGNVSWNICASECWLHSFYCWVDASNRLLLPVDKPSPLIISLLATSIIIFSSSKIRFASDSSKSCGILHGRPKHLLCSFAIWFSLSRWGFSVTFGMLYFWRFVVRPASPFLYDIIALWISSWVHFHIIFFNLNHPTINL